ncbi:MAG: 3-isopropylmalate dehydratase small subunit [Sulfurospirillum sp.]|nr:3-isopropylmalate dehydratase small subunit [Sulfurospirillum sp.]MBL0702725.1 3-isopropylmalate dehydratase small subunit [Sulfurospirillum sp.]
MHSINGKVWVFGDNIDTDLIIAARYLNTSNPKELAKHVMEDIDPTFIERLKMGDIIVAGENFGCGSSREHAPLALKAAGISAIVAKSFARIFYRNAFNIGLPIFELNESSKIEENDTITINMNSGTLKSKNSSKIYKFIPIPKFMQTLVGCGGLMNYIKKSN